MKTFSKIYAQVVYINFPASRILQMSWWASPLKFALYIICMSKSKTLCMVLKLHFPSLVMYNRISEGWWGWWRWNPRAAKLGLVHVESLVDVIFKLHETCPFDSLLFISTLFKVKQVRQVILHELIQHFRAMREVAPPHLHCHNHNIEHSRCQNSKLYWETLGK